MSVEATASAPAAQDLEGSLIEQRYRLIQLLGEGSMGAVYRAEHVHMRKPVAIKVLHPEMMQVAEVVARFEREAIAAAAIAHPNVAAATDFGRLEDGSCYLVLEYVQGRDLRQLLHEVGSLPAERTMHIALQIAKALTAAHGVGIVHRDLKPENIMLVERDDESDFVKVLDFGIAKMSLEATASGQPLTQAGAVFGTPTYMSPEQALGREVDFRSDLYSLGILMFEMLIGMPPFDDSELAVVLAMQISEPHPALPDNIPVCVRDIVDKLLAKQPAERYESTQQAVDAIQCCLDQLRGITGRTSGRPENTQHTEHTEDVAVLSTQPLAASDPTQIVGSTAYLYRALAKLSRAKARWNEWVSAVDDERPIAFQRYAPWMLTRVKLGPMSFTVWKLVFAAIVLLIVTFTTIAIGVAISDDKKPLTAVTGIKIVSREIPSPAVPAKYPSMEEIERIPGAQRSVNDWWDLAKYYAATGRTRDSVAAYRSVLRLEPKHLRNPEVLTALRNAAKDPSVYPMVVSVLEVRRHGVGPVGPELLWDIWNDQRAENNPEEDTTFRKLVVLSANAAAPLRIAIDLHATNKCSRLKAMMLRADKHADQRSVARLEHLQSKSTCNEPDCFGCLNKSEVLQRALNKARRRPSPSMQNGYR